MINFKITVPKKLKEKSEEGERFIDLRPKKSFRAYCSICEKVTLFEYYGCNNCKRENKTCIHSCSICKNGSGLNSGKIGKIFGEAETGQLIFSFPASPVLTRKKIDPGAIG